jgi:hypothetical protein
MVQVLQLGDHLVSPRGLYTHHGLYIGDGTAIHYAGNAQPGVRGPVKKVSLDAFKGNSSFYIKRHFRRKFDRQESVERAKSRLGEDLYCLFANNCEHFVLWCINDEQQSPQVRRGAGVAVSGFGAVGTGFAVGTISAGGEVAGLSASGIMSGLAGTGGFVGSGAVAGLAMFAIAPATIATVTLKYTVFKDSPALTSGERQARRAGIWGTLLGGIGATYAGIAAVSTAGSVAGLSAAGISSGLAALGGSMIFGVAGIITAPAIVGASVGYASYRIVRWVRQPKAIPGVTSK